MKKLIYELLGTIFGAIIISIAISLLLLPNELSSGGFSGIGTILYYLFNIPIGLTMFFLNIPLLIFAGYKLGKKFFLKTVIGIISLSVFSDYFTRFEVITQDKILACVYGGVLTGIGTAIIFKVNSSTGGSDLLSIIFKIIYPHIEMGKAIIMIDSIIVVLNVILLRNIEIGLYSAITIYLVGVMIDVVFEGIFFSKLVFIISDKYIDISEKIENKLEHGVTGLYGRGMYTQNNKVVLMCAISRREIAILKSIVIKIDPDAFIIVANSREVLGHGFKKLEK